MTQRKGETLEEFKARESAYKKMAYERKKAEKAAAEAELKKMEDSVNTEKLANTEKTSETPKSDVKVTVVNLDSYNIASKAFLSTL